MFIILLSINACYERTICVSEALGLSVLILAYQLGKSTLKIP